MNKDKPFWMPDTQGFLAVAIIALMASVIWILLLKDYTNLNEKVYGALLTLLGVLAACFKDVYSFFFGSSKGSEKKDDAMIATSLGPNPPPKTTVTIEPEKTTTVTEPTTVTETSKEWTK